MPLNLYARSDSMTEPGGQCCTRSTNSRVSGERQRMEQMDAGQDAAMAHIRQSDRNANELVSIGDIVPSVNVHPLK